jgi:hypothetical protein
VIKSDLFLRIASLGVTISLRAIHALEGMFEREYVKGVLCKVKSLHPPLDGGVREEVGVETALTLHCDETGAIVPAF